ncbi:MAG: M23 family metallopeptidase [Flavobacteriales bacterium]
MDWRWVRIVLSVATLMTMAQGHSSAQRLTDTLNFRNPVDIPMRLSGNFGEFRTNHFHTGIDVKTDRKTGFPVYAVADGWVRRVKVSPFGYGKALYLDHPSGHTSVYAHLENYNDTISAFLKLAQKTLGRNEVDIFPNKNRLPVKRGDFIGFTGNSGGSGGPHLHFEIRTSDTEKPLNPLLMGFDIKDDVPPNINGVLVESFNPDTLRGRVMDTRRYYTRAASGRYSVKETVKVNALSGLSIHTLDYLSNSRNSCGVYSIDLSLDGEQIYSMKLDSLDFSTSRYINAHKSYELFLKEKSSFHRCFVLPNNKLEIYTTTNSGLISLADNEVHQVNVVITDAAGNQSFLDFKIQKSEKDLPISKRKKEAHQYVKFDEANSISTEECSLRIPPFRLINDELVSLEIYTKKNGDYSKYFQVGDRSIPLQNKCILSLKLNDSLDIDTTKFFITRYNPVNGRYYTQGGAYKDGWIRTRVKEFGIYTVSYDAVEPVVKWNAADLNQSKTIRIRVTDDNSGIDEYSLEIDGTWVPLYYDYKRARLEGRLEDELKITSESQYRLKVSDASENTYLEEGTF